MVQEYERAVIFRLGRLLSGGSRGPGKYLEYNSARWFFGGGKLLQLHLGFFRDGETPKLLKRRSCGGELPAAHWCIVAIGIAIFELSGIFFVLPCVENYTKVDLRTSAIDIPPQEVCFMYDQKYYIYLQLTTTYNNAQPWSAWSKKMKKKGTRDKQNELF